MRAVFAIGVAATALGGCAAWSGIHPPGRDSVPYEACLENHVQFQDDTPRPGAAPTTTQSSEAGQLAALVGAIASGKAFTRDVYKGTSPPAAATESEKLAGRQHNPSPAPEDLREAESTPFQQFLDCYLGPVDPIDYDTRLLRGHTALAILAEYTALEVTDATPSKRKDYASTALSKITDAELALESGSYTEANQLWGATATASSSSVKLITALPPVNAHGVKNVSRIQQIIDLAAFADTVAFRNEYAALIELIVKSAKNVSVAGIAQGVAQGAVNTLTAAASVNDYGAAYFQESANLLYPVTKCRPGDIAQPMGMCISTPLAIDSSGEAVANLLGLDTHGALKDCTTAAGAASSFCLRHAAWKRWNISISDACTKLSGLAGSANTNTCLPTADQLQKVSDWVADPAASTTAGKPASPDKNQKAGEAGAVAKKKRNPAPAGK